MDAAISFPGPGPGPAGSGHRARSALVTLALAILAAAACMWRYHVVPGDPQMGDRLSLLVLLAILIIGTPAASTGRSPGCGSSPGSSSPSSRWRTCSPPPGSSRTS